MGGSCCASETFTRRDYEDSILSEATAIREITVEERDAEKRDHEDATAKAAADPTAVAKRAKLQTLREDDEEVESNDIPDEPQAEDMDTPGLTFSRCQITKAAEVQHVAQQHASPEVIDKPGTVKKGTGENNDTVKDVGGEIDEVINKTTTVEPRRKSEKEDAQQHARLEVFDTPCAEKKGNSERKDALRNLEEELDEVGNTAAEMETLRTLEKDDASKKAAEEELKKTAAELKAVLAAEAKRKAALEAKRAMAAKKRAAAKRQLDVMLKDLNVVPKQSQYQKGANRRDVALEQGPTQLQCGNCAQIFAVPPGDVQCTCPACKCVNMCPTPQRPMQDVVHLQCKKCTLVFGAPRGHAHCRCPACNSVNACPARHDPIPQQVYNQPLGIQPAPVVDEPAPRPSGKRRALLVGINYFGTSAELKGCINDVKRMLAMIVTKYGFSPNYIRTLTDNAAEAWKRPTRANILKNMRWLVEDVQPGDCLFFHYSGHGAQQEDPMYAEEDGYDETICPEDFETEGMIVDNEIFDQIVAVLPSGSKLTAVMDCCHSGTGLDLPFIWKNGHWNEEDNPCHSAGDVQLISGCQDEQCSMDATDQYNRPAGALTTAFCNTLERNSVLTYPALLQELRNELEAGQFDQIPSLSSSQSFDAPSRKFSLIDGIVANMNPALGRMFRKKKHPRRDNLMHGPLSEILMAGALGFIPVDLVGGVADSLQIGGRALIDMASPDASLDNRGGALAAGSGRDMFDNVCNEEYAGTFVGGGGGGFFGAAADFFLGDDE